VSEIKTHNGLYLGIIRITHKGCWISDLSSIFPDIEVIVYFLNFDTDYYDAFVIIRHKNNQPFSNEMKEQIFHYLVGKSSVIEISAVNYDPKQLAFHLRVRDLRTREIMRTLIQSGGKFHRLIPVKSVDGVEINIVLINSKEQWYKIIERFKEMYQDEVISTELRRVDDILEVTDSMRELISKDEMSILKSIMKILKIPMNNIIDFPQIVTIIEWLVKHVLFR